MGLHGKGRTDCRIGEKIDGTVDVFRKPEVLCRLHDGGIQRVLRDPLFRQSVYSCFRRGKERIVDEVEQRAFHTGIKERRIDFVDDLSFEKAERQKFARRRVKGGEFFALADTETESTEIRAEGTGKGKIVRDVLVRAQKEQRRVVCVEVEDAAARGARIVRLRDVEERILQHEVVCLAEYAPLFGIERRETVDGLVDFLRGGGGVLAG